MVQKTMADEIARKHGVRLDPNDPILILGTVGESISSSVAKAMDDANTKATNTVGKYLEEAKSATERMINGGGTWLVDQVKQSHASALAEIRVALADAVAEYKAEVDRAIDRLTRLTWWAACLAGTGVLLAAGGFLGLFLRHFFG